MTVPRTLAWIGQLPGTLRLLDQTLLPNEIREIECRSVEQVWEAIRLLRVRGAPAIGCAAAYGIVLGVQDVRDNSDSRMKRLETVANHLATSRPTAVNLFWAIDRMKSAAIRHQTLSLSEWLARLLVEAQTIEQEDRDMCAAIGRHGATLMPDHGAVLTHCNAGSLATAGDGTALSVFYAAVAAGKQLTVYADETRPLLQGARLTAWELRQRNIPVTVICDSMAAVAIRDRQIKAIVVGADRIAANGDTANKIGTYGLAVQARYHGVPFYVAAPTSTFDFSTGSGDDIPIEERQSEEIATWFGSRTVPIGASVWNPAFDVTPAELVSAIITERGVVASPTMETIAALNE